MNRIFSLAFAVLTLCGLCATDASATGKAAKNYLDWKLLTNGAPSTAPAKKGKDGAIIRDHRDDAGVAVMSGAKVTLLNVTANESLRYGKRTFGINLVWDRSTTLNNIHIDKQGGGALKYGDVVAIHVLNGGYLRHQKRDIGINLVWSTPPVYEWTLVGGQSGEPVKTGTALGLHNDHANDFVIYGERPATSGINLRWWKDRELSGGLLDRAKGVAGDLAKKGFMKLAERYVLP